MLQKKNLYKIYVNNRNRIINMSLVTLSTNLNSEHNKLWELSCLHYCLFDTTKELSIMEKAMLTLKPELVTPPIIPSYVITYLNIDAQLHLLKYDISNLRKACKILGISNNNKRRKLNNVCEQILGDNMNSEHIITMTDEKKIQNKIINKTLLNEQLELMSENFQLDSNKMKELAKYVLERHQTIIPQQLFRKHQRKSCKRKNETTEEFMLQLNLHVCFNEEEKILLQNIDIQAHSSMNAQDVNTIKRVNIIQYRLQKGYDIQQQWKEQLKQLTSSVVQWLNSIENQQLNLKDGLLQLKEHIKYKRMTNKSCELPICEYLIQMGHQQPLELTKAIVQTLQ